MVPSQSAQLETSGKGFSAHIERLHADFASTNPIYRVDVRIENQLPHEVRVAPEKIELAELSSAHQVNQPVDASSGVLEGIDIVSPVGGAMTGAQAGSSLGRVTGSGGIGGGVAGAGLGMAGAVLLVLPLAIVEVVDAAIVDGEKNLDHGESGTYRITLPSMPIDDGKSYALVLDGAVGLPRGALQPLPLVRPGQTHLGYLEPGDATWIFSARVGGGVIRRAPVTAGLGGLEIFIGRQIGRLAFGGFGTFGAGAWGAEMRLRFEPARVLSIVPFFGYGYYPLVGYLGFNAGHGPRWGFELQFPVGNAVRFGYARNSAKIGLFALGGPIVLNAIDGVGFAGQLGMSFGIF